MITPHRCAVLAASLLVGLPLIEGASAANVFNMPGTQKSLAFVPVGDAGNPADVTSLGAVNYTYQIATFDVTVAQYVQFLNAVAASDPYGLYDASMANTSVPSVVGCGIVRNGSAGSYTYSPIGGRENFPVNYVSWGDAARFCNWLANGQPTGSETSGTTETGSYTLNGAVTAAALNAVTRNLGATYVLPTNDEWYKAAYYKGGSTDAGYWRYPTQSDTAPSNVESSNGINNANYNNGSFTDPANYLTAVGTFAGSPGPYGTFDMGGDVYQWEENKWLGGGVFSNNVTFLDAFYYLDASVQGMPATDDDRVGFRVVDLAAVPEPASLALLGVASAGMLMQGRRFPKRGRAVNR